MITYDTFNALQWHISYVLMETVVVGKVATHVMSARSKLIAEMNV
jgi:hypothetical protein